MPRFSVCLCMVGLLAASACSVAADPVPPSRKPTPVPAQAEERAIAAPIAGEVPAALLDKLRADLAGRQGVASSAIKVVRSEAVNWPNGGLGCAKPGEVYTQAIVPGYRVLLEVSGKEYAYHAARQGHFRLCDNESNSGMERGSIR